MVCHSTIVKPQKARGNTAAADKLCPESARDSLMSKEQERADFDVRLAAAIEEARAAGFTGRY